MKKLIILAAAFALVASFALTAAAAEWNFYGSARMQTWSDNVEKTGVKDDRDTTWDVQGNSRIGATVKVSDTMVGAFEYGTGVNLRKLYGEWNFGAGKLLAGQTYTPASSMFYSNQVYGQDNDLLNCGQAYIGRIPMLQLTFGTLKIAFVRPNTSTPAGLTGDQDITLPKLEASYQLKMDNFFVDIYGGYQTYEVASVDINSYLVGVGGGADFGAAFVKANVYMAQNGKAYGLSGLGNSSLGYDAVKNDIVDMDTLGYLLVAGFKVSDTVTIEAGYGAIQHELDVSGSKEDDAATYYLNASITLAPGVFVVPEIGVVDLKDTAAGADEGKTTYFGAKWQMNF
ncbi:MAG: hypothetical protein V1793_19025 [Pseudomonadota bacterium]